MERKDGVSRRQTLKSIGVIGASGILGAEAGRGAEGANRQASSGRSSGARDAIFERVSATAIVDTHEHLIEEEERLQGASHPRVSSDDWTMLFSHYLDSDMRVAGMPGEAMDKFFSPKVDPADKWKLLEPYWPAVKNTGYGQAVRLAISHLYDVEKATEQNLPVKLHTGYYAGEDSMPLGRLMNNPGSATELCRQAERTRFVFMHICYPYYEEMIAIAKQWSNAYIDMCWSWIINPVGAKDFLKKLLVSAPSNKILTFGGDYIPVEPVLGHAVIARRGIALALSELVEEGWVSLDDALDMVDPIMRGNAREIFNLDEKTKALGKVKWS